MPSFKTASSMKLLAHYEHVWSSINIMLEFCALKCFRKWRFTVSRFKRKAVAALAKRVVPTLDPGVCVALGKWSSQTHLAGHMHVPLKRFAAELSRRATLIMVDEFRTSLLCSDRFQPMTGMPFKIAGTTNTKLSRNARRCRNEACQATCWVRDVNAAKNMWQLGQLQVAGQRRPRQFVQVYFLDLVEPLMSLGRQLKSMATLEHILVDRGASWWCCDLNPMMASWGLAALLLLATASTAASRSVWVAQELFENANCSGAPNAVSLATVNGCSPRQCSSVQVDNVTQFMTLECDIVDRFAYAEAVFGEFNYIVVEDYAGAGCDNLKLTVILPATGSCASSTMYDSYSVVASLFANGSAVISLYQDKTCDGDAYMDFVLDSGNISSGDCVQDYYKFYTSASGGLMDAGSDSGSSSNSITQEASGSSSVGGLAIVGIVIAAGVVGFMTAVFVWRRRLPGDEQRTEDSACIVGYDSYTSLRNVPKSTVLSTGTNNSSYSREGREHRSISYFWDDDAIAAARVDRDRIEFERVISNGGYGQVWSGWLNGQHVAVKMLLPENRKVMKHLNSFLDEVKLLSVLEHQRIVRFLGVAWDSLSDLCLLTEFMEGGDLRTLLSSYETENDPVGFNESKTRIALHVAHALTYLHSLDPPVLHRDLKSKNILLSADLDARLTDFGVSREHVDQTMTAGVGTSRWMAPEVLMGERYDDKADVFSMGVVLSELDVHALPYSHAVEDSNPSRNMSSTAIVHLVAMGKLRVHFSSTGPVAELGRSCVAIDPNDRPTAAEALYKLHTILTTEFGRGSGES